MFVEGIYDLLIELKQYPYLEARREYVHTMTIMNITEYLSNINLDEPMTVGKLKHKLAVIGAMGYAEDGGFPILSDGDVLEGYIATSEVLHGLEQLEETLKPTMTENEINEVPCYFKRLADTIALNTDAAVSFNIMNEGLKTPVRNLLDSPLDAEEDQYLETMAQKQSLNDFSQYIDHVSYRIKFDTHHINIHL
jgi:chloride channel 3/4/5